MEIHLSRAAVEDLFTSGSQKLRGFQNKSLQARYFQLNYFDVQIN